MDIIIRLEAIAVHATGHVADVELDFVVLCINLAVDQFCHLLPVRVDDREHCMRATWQCVLDFSWAHGLRLPHGNSG
jgi:hypothetical protein